MSLSFVFFKSNRLLLYAAMAIGLGVAGCGKKEEPASGSTAESAKTSGSKTVGAKEKGDVFQEMEKNLSAGEKRFFHAGKPFAMALAGRKYDEVYRLFSSHARARMSLNQFVPSTDDAVSAENEKNAMADVTPEKFAELMKKVEEQHGMPRAVQMLSVFSTDHAVLTRTSKEQTGVIDSMFAIGAMPESTPMDIRRASLRGQIRTDLSPAQLEQVAKDHGTTVDELKKDPDFSTYFNFKIVLVEEEGQLKVGYFEFLPPSMMD